MDTRKVVIIVATVIVVIVLVAIALVSYIQFKGSFGGIGENTPSSKVPTEEKDPILEMALAGAVISACDAISDTQLVNKVPPTDETYLLLKDKCYLYFLNQNPTKEALQKYCPRIKNEVLKKRYCEEI